MDPRLKNILWDGEEVVWIGRPQPFHLLAKPFHLSILCTWAISALAVTGISLLLISMLRSGTRSVTDVLILALITVFLPAILSARPLLDKRCLEERALYAITSLRVISIVGNERMHLCLDKNLKLALEAQDDGCGTLRFGELVGQPQSKSRVHAMLGLRSDEGRGTITGLLFYHIAQPEQLMRFLA